MRFAMRYSHSSSIRVRLLRVLLGSLPVQFLSRAKILLALNSLMNSEQVCYKERIRTITEKKQKKLRNRQ
jgi:hypothetical protein